MTLRACLLLLLLPPLAVADNHAPLHFVIAAEQSWIRVLVYRAGLLSRLGHNHVIATRDLSGFVLCSEQLTDVNAELSFPAASLVVDAPGLRDLEGDDFPGHLSEKDISGTRKNMLGRKLLNASSYPVISIVSTRVTGEPGSLLVSAKVTVAGITNSIQFAASADLAAEKITISGTAVLTHSDLGLKPFSTAFGTLKTDQEIVVRFEIVAVPVR